ncbi:lysozyme inhibitor LprI family protein [Chitinolyticbacter albus]|uniref:lysozyme inhibitor LprI family protein n=1 Tax=Chitinolyticbacter albus TaxID=2961951 RepID=UPI00210ACFC8|nr:lysozyme inhibitor LprI family protein [Chitinolyticbacter albus]
MRPLLCSILLACLACVPSRADTTLSTSYRNCMEQARGVTARVLDCMNREYAQQDQRVSAAYQVLLAQQGRPRKVQLHDAQQAWLKFRQANCNYYADPNGGNLARVIASDCLLTVTAARVAELEGLLQ